MGVGRRLSIFLPRMLVAADYGARKEVVKKLRDKLEAANTGEVAPN